MIEALAFDAIRIARQNQRAILQIREQPIRDRAVILDEIALRVAFLRPEDLVEVRQAQIALLWHPKLARAPGRGVHRRARHWRRNVRHVVRVLSGFLRCTRVESVLDALLGRFVVA